MFASNANEVIPSRLQKLYAKWAYGTALSIWINSLSKVLYRVKDRICCQLYFLEYPFFRVSNW